MGHHDEEQPVSKAERISQVLECSDGEAWSNSPQVIGSNLGKKCEFSSRIILVNIKYNTKKKLKRINTIFIGEGPTLELARVQILRYDISIHQSQLPIFSPEDHMKTGE